MMQTKLKSASSVPYMHISCEVDMFGAKISLKKYQTMVGIANKYGAQLIGSINQSSTKQI